MKLGKRRKDDDPAAEPATGADPVVPGAGMSETWTAPASGAEPAASYGDEGIALEPAVDSEAVELVGDAAPAPGPPAPPVAFSMPDPLPPVAPAAPVAPPAASAASRITLPPPIPNDTLAAGGAASFDAPATDPVIDELRLLATERPEIVVGAAFAGGIVAAMILRRLGN